MVFIIVAIQKGLNTLKSALKSRGYEVVDLGEYNYPIDAMIYEGSSFSVSHISRNNMPAMSGSITINGERPSYGVFMINAIGKSVDEIECMLKNRYYSPLF